MQNLNANLAESRHDAGVDLAGEDTIRGKLLELRKEFERGQQQLAALDQSRNTLRDTLLRISGAIQVLEEILPTQDRTGANGERSPQEHLTHSEAATT